MSNPRITLKGATLDACNRIIAQTPIENYTELFKLLLMRYEQEFIEATNGYLRQAKVASQLELVTPQPQLDTTQPPHCSSRTLTKPAKVLPKTELVTPQPELDTTQPDKGTSKAITKPTRVLPQPQLDISQPTKSAKQMLMDFTD